MSEIILHTKELPNGEYLEYGPSVEVYVHKENCPIEPCGCEPEVKEGDVLI